MAIHPRMLDAAIAAFLNHKALADFCCLCCEVRNVRAYDILAHPGVKRRHQRSSVCQPGKGAAMSRMRMKIPITPRNNGSR